MMCLRRQWLGDKLTRVLHENAAVAPQDGRRLREVAAAAADKYGLPVTPPRLPAAGPNGGARFLSNLRVCRLPWPQN